MIFLNIPISKLKDLKNSGDVVFQHYTKGLHTAIQGRLLMTDRETLHWKGGLTHQRLRRMIGRASQAQDTSFCKHPPHIQNAKKKKYQVQSEARLVWVGL